MKDKVKEAVIEVPATEDDIKKWDERHPAEVPAVQEDSPNAVVMMAMQKGYDPALIEKMMDLAERNDANIAKRAYHQAMANFKAAPPEIRKDKRIEYDTNAGKTSYDHARLGTATQKINKALSQHGLSASWETDQNDKQIKVRCKITHVLGHCESTELSAAADTSGGKNSIQALGSTITYLERYTLFALTGLAAKDQDDDGQAAEPVEYINEDQVIEINDLIKETGTKKNLFLKWCKSESVETIPDTKYKAVIAELQKKKANMRQPGE